MLNNIDFSEAKIIDELIWQNNSLMISCYGITLLKNVIYKNGQYCFEEVFNNCLTDMYLSGKCDFIFRDIISYSIKYSNNAGFIEGKTIILSENSSQESYSVAVFPSIPLYKEKIWTNKWIDIKVKTTSPFEVSYNESDLIQVSEYCKNPLKYGYP